MTNIIADLLCCAPFYLAPWFSALTTHYNHLESLNSSTLIISPDSNDRTIDLIYAVIPHSKIQQGKFYQHFADEIEAQQVDGLWQLQLPAATVSFLPSQVPSGNS